MELIRFWISVNMPLLEGEREVVELRNLFLNLFTTRHRYWYRGDTGGRNDGLTKGSPSHTFGVSKDFSYSCFLFFLK